MFNKNTLPVNLYSLPTKSFFFARTTRKISRPPIILSLPIQAKNPNLLLLAKKIVFIPPKAKG